MASEKWQEWIGRKGDIVPGPYPVSVASVGYLAEALEDDRLADQIASGGAIKVPRSFATIASRVPNWRSRNATGAQSFMQAMLVPLPTDSGVNLGIDQTYLAPLKIGDAVSSQSTITEITPKRTRLGEGFIVTERIDHLNQDGVLVAQTVNTLLRFAKTAPDNSAGAAKSAPGSKPAFETPASDFPPILTPITLTKLVVAAAAVRDFSPLHHDSDFARGAGHPTAFVSYSFQIALAILALGRWFGSDDRVHRLRLAMKLPIYVNKTCVCTGVRQKSDDASEGVETIALTLSTEDGLCSSGTAEVAGEGA